VLVSITTVPELPTAYVLVVLEGFCSTTAVLSARTEPGVGVAVGTLLGALATLVVTGALVELRTLVFTTNAAAPAASTPAIERVVAMPTFISFLLGEPVALGIHRTVTTYNGRCGDIQETSKFHKYEAVTGELA
jgi:hypothetical protein